MSDSPFTLIQADAANTAGLIVYWELDPTFNEEGPYNFTLQSSEDPKFTQLVLNKPVGDSYFGIDDSKLVQTRPSSFLYRVKLTTGKGNTYYSASLFHDYQKVDWYKYSLAKEIVRKELLRIRKYTGFKTAWLLKHKNYNILAKQDVDPISGVPINDETTSFGTKYEGGFYKALKVNYSREDHEEKLFLDPKGDGVSQEKEMTIRMVGFPRVAPRDVLVTDFGERYNFQFVKTRFMPGTNIILVQNCALKLIPVTNPVYKIEVNG